MSENSREIQNEGAHENLTSDENASKPQTLPSNAEQVPESSQSFVISPQVNEIFEWIEAKLGLLKVLQGTDESTKTTTNDKSDKDTLDEIMEDIQKINFKEDNKPADCISEEATKVLDMLEETTSGLLDSLNPSVIRWRNVKVLATLIQHLSSNVGNRVTHDDIEKHISERRVMELYSDVQNSREAILKKMVLARNYIGHGVKKIRSVTRKCRRHSYAIDRLFSGDSTSADLSRSDQRYLKWENEKLKAVAKESEYLLIKYSDSVGCLARKTKTFFRLKQDSERVLSSFMTKEIPDLYKT